MKIDCTTCPVRNIACDDCVVSLLLHLPAPDHRLDEVETSALELLADSGLVPKLRLVQEAEPLSENRQKAV
jgi:hypothetical protein